MLRIAIVLLLLIAGSLNTAAVAQTKPLDFEGRSWRITAQKAEVVEHLERQAIALTGGRVWLDDAGFTNGVISFDVAYRENVAFIGAGWRAADDSHYEEMYFRAHLNNKPDALQYTPVVNTLSAWQIFSDENSISPVSQNFVSWNQVKIVVEDDRADIYFNSQTPVLHIPDLKTNLKKGAVALRSSGRGGGTTYFSKINVRPLEAGDGIIGQPKPMPKLPLGLIDEWNVSTPFAEELVDGALELDSAMLGGLTWADVATETNGIANLAKLANPVAGGDTMFVRLNLDSDKRQIKELLFGYSDRVRIYLNGKRIFSGDSSYRARDYRFLGTVGFFDSVGLDLRAGSNEVIIAVSETFGGWAWAGALSNREGVRIR